MRRIRSPALLLVAIAVTDVAESQQTNNPQFSSDGHGRRAAYGLSAPPFFGAVLSDPAQPSVYLFCLDFLNSATFEHQWSAFFTNIGDGTSRYARHGIIRIGQNRRSAIADQQALEGMHQWAGLRTAFWNLVGAGVPYLVAAEQTWLTAANTSVCTSAWQDISWANGSPGDEAFGGTGVSGGGGGGGGGGEQLITGAPGSTQLTEAHVAPEPATWILLATGLVAIAGFAALRAAWT
ncbi:MAG: PEP-CTERM sorting domain-containing protein [Gemmatimonadaceae bacterium]